MTYSVCAQHVKDQAGLDETMMALWLLYWTTAAELAATTGSVREILLAVAHSHAGADIEVAA